MTTFMYDREIYEHELETIIRALAFYSDFLVKKNPSFQDGKTKYNNPQNALIEELQQLESNDEGIIKIQFLDYKVFRITDALEYFIIKGRIRDNYYSFHQTGVEFLDYKIAQRVLEKINKSDHFCSSLTLSNSI